MQATPPVPCKYIIYLVPQGELYELLERYYEESRSVCANDAHDYLPHCTLTSFFTLPIEEDVSAVLLRRLTSALGRVVAAVAHGPDGKPQEPLAWVEGLYDKDGAIGLAVRAPKIISAIQRLADEMGDSSAANEGGASDSAATVVIAPKTRLHISMAYGGGVTRAATPQLYTLARELNTRRQSLGEPIRWRVELLRRAAHHAGQPKLWMLDSLWSSVLPTS